MRRRWQGVTVVVALATMPTGCGGPESSDSQGGPDVPDVPVHTVEVSETDSGQVAFELPSTALTGGIVTFRLENEGKEWHAFQLVRATAGHTVEELGKVGSGEPLPAWLQPIGGVGATAPGETSEATLIIGPGNYWYFDTESNAQGSRGELALVGESGAPFPSANAKWATTEKGFYFDGNGAGDRTVVVVNDGQQPHHVVLLPVAKGSTFAKAEQALLDGRTDAVEFEKRVSTAILGPGQRLVTDVRYRKGSYVLACFLPDPGTAGPPHLTRGMLIEMPVE